MLKGLNLLIEPKDMSNPNGIAPIRVTANNKSVFTKPSFKALNTIGNCSAKVIIGSFIQTENREPLCSLFFGT